MRIQRIAPERQKGNNSLPLVDLSLMDSLIATYGNKKGSLIPLLQGIQTIFGFLPKEALVKLSRETGHELSDLYGVATFYAQFRLSPPGKYLVKMCHGTACHVLQVSQITEELLDHLEIQDGQTTPDRLFTVETVACLGCCSLAPAMMIGDEADGKLTPQSALRIVKELKRASISQPIAENL